MNTSNDTANRFKYFFELFSLGCVVNIGRKHTVVFVFDTLIFFFEKPPCVFVGVCREFARKAFFGAAVAHNAVIYGIKRNVNAPALRYCGLALYTKAVRVKVTAKLLRPALRLKDKIIRAAFKPRRTRHKLIN